MTHSPLLASATLFRSLYDNNKDIYDVISEFIRAFIILNSKWSFNATECTDGVNETFNFNIPEAVIKTCLKKRLKKTEGLSLDEKGIFTVTKKFNRDSNIQSEYRSSQSEYKEISQRLISHSQKYENIIYDFDEEKLLSYFTKYLLNKNIPNEYATLFAHFSLKNQSDHAFKEKLNRIEEGIILYTGIQYSPDLSNLGNWPGNLTIFLDTEHLFNATGLNGVLYKQIFDDLVSLIREVNQKKGKNGKIYLRYFQETNNEVDSFFHATENIFKSMSSYDPSKTAMVNIINGCRSQSDIKEKKTKFKSDLLHLNILIEESQNYYANPEFNVESLISITNLKEKYNNHYEDNKFEEILKIFTKINYFRKNVHNIGIENTSAIFLTENRLTQSVAFSDEVYDGKGNIPFATNIEFLTERLWFKLNKGFGENKSKPHSFDVITKAKLVLSSQVSSAVSDEYNKLSDKFKKGEINKESTALLIAELRQKTLDPGSITFDDLDESLHFMSENTIEKVLREKSALEKRAKEGELACIDLRKIKIERKKEKVQPLKKSARRLFRFLQILTAILVLFLIYYLIHFLRSDSDTTLSIISGVITFLAFLVTIINTKKVNLYLWRQSRKYYRCSLNAKVLWRTNY